MNRNFEQSWNYSVKPQEVGGGSKAIRLTAWEYGQSVGAFRTEMQGEYHGA